MTLPPPLGTVDYAIWAYTREMERAEAERQRKIFFDPKYGEPWEHVEEEAHG